MSKSHVNLRKQSGFLYLISGRYRFRFGEEELLAEAEDLVYLPEGSSYSFELSGEKPLCIMIETSLTYGNDSFVFCTHPTVADRESTEKARAAVSSLTDTSGRYERMAAVLYCLDAFSSIKDSISDGPNSRIMPALKYIEEHCNEKIKVRDAARLCFISESQLRRIFEKELGMSPIEYKNQRRMHLAMNMLKYSHSGVGEIASSLGFESVYVFSRVFKKHVGVSPTDFRKNIEFLRKKKLKYDG
jgi:iron complex transport system substrate-binding protein